MQRNPLHICISLLIAFCVLINSDSHAQAIRTDELKSKFSTHRISNLSEKVFLHLDRTGYVTGETLWFKAYVVNASSHEPTLVSSVVYVEILSSANLSVLQASIELKNGSGSGSFYIPATLENGNYTVRAYTKWMRNFSSDYFFQQAITIINPFKTPELATTTKSPRKLDVQFLPEGGNLIDGIGSKIAFRVTDERGKGISCTGTLVDENNQAVATFRTAQFGLGTFEFTPQVGKRYHVIVKDKDGEESTHPFAAIQPGGYTLRVLDTAESVNVAISTKGASSPLIYVFVHGRQQIINITHGFQTENRFELAIPKNEFIDGVNHITVFNEQLQPVAERLYFKKPSSRHELNIQTDQTSYINREKVKVSIKLPGSINSAINASVSVYRNDSFPSTNHQDIESYLSLTSDLHGTIESPEWYFAQDNDAVFDMLMLTHGWRRFSWQQVLESSDSVQRFLPEIQAPIFSGRLFDETGKPASNIETYFASPSYPIQLYTAISKRDGRIDYVLKDFFGPHKAVLQTNLNRDSLYDFRMESNFSDSPASLNHEKLDFSAAHERQIIERSLSMQVQDIYYPDSVTRLDKDSTAFYGRADETYYLDDFTRFTVMEEVMREYVPGVWVRKRKGDFYFIVLDVVNKSVFRDDALVLIDGVPMFNLNQLMAFDPLKVRKLEVITRLFFLGRTSFNGIVSYSTYSGDLAGYALHPKSKVIDVEGLQLRREFYQPRYDQKTFEDSRLPDQRHLLLWNPNLTIKNGKAEIDLFTSDLNGTFEIHIEGLSNTGQSTSGRASFIVKSGGE